MRSFINEHFAHFLCGMIFLARCGDVLTTWLATPTLRNEANPIAKKLGWLYAVATIFTCFFAYYDMALGFTVLGASLCVCASNASKIWMMRTMGEEAFRQHAIALIKKSGLASALFFSCLPALFYFSLGFIIMFVDRSPPTWGYHLGMGIICFGFVIIVYMPLQIRKLYYQGRRA